MKILILPGDGIGPEITAVTRSALEVLDRKFALGLEFVERDIGMAAIEKGLDPMPDAIMEEVRATPFTILGPVSTMEYPPGVQHLPSPSSLIRDKLDLFAKVVVPDHVFLNLVLHRSCRNVLQMSAYDSCLSVPHIIQH